MRDSLFEEKQYFRQWWLWVIMLFIIGDMLWQMSKGFMELGTVSIEHALFDILFPLIPIIIVAFFKAAHLHTKITKEGVYVKFFPIHLRFKYYPWEVISKLYIRKCSPIAEYGGWGLRGFGSNRALNISGNMGLQLKFINDSKLFIGTQQAGKMDEVLSMMQDVPFESIAYLNENSKNKFCPLKKLPMLCRKLF